jgi:peptidyl-prolyl cis-trans isomerase D
LLHILRRGSKAVLWVVIIGVGGVFVLYLGFRGGLRGGPHDGGPVVRAGEFAFDGRDLERIRQGMEQRYREALGDQFDSQAARGFLVESAGSVLLRSALLAWQGDQMGLTASDAEIRDYLRDSGLVDAHGQLDRERITQFAESEFGTVRHFQERLRSDLLADKTARLIFESAAVSDAEARDAVRYQLEEVKIAAVKIDGRTPPPDLELPAEAGQALLQKDPERVRKSYEERKGEFDRPEQAHIRHILARFEAADEATKQAARERIDAIRKRIEGGEAFAAVAKEASEDPATKDNGGDLGFVSRGGVVKPLEDAAFAQEPGKLGEVIESPQGFHLLLVEERRTASVVPFEEAQAQVANDLARQDAAAAVARAKAEEVSKAVGEGLSVVDAARKLGLEILRPDAIRRRPDGYVAQIGAAPELVAAAFTLTEEKPSDPRIHTADENVFVLIQLLERKTPSDAEIEQALGPTRARLLEQRRNAAEQAWLEQLREELTARGELVYDLAAFRK